MDQTQIEVSAALANVRRRARLLEDSRGGWSWRDLGVMVPLAMSIYLIFSGSAEVSQSTVGLILLATVIGAWQHHRLRVRVEAMSRLLTEIGYPGEA